jgi:hypothetical protein
VTSSPSGATFTAAARVPSGVAGLAAARGPGRAQKLGAAELDELYEGLIGRLRRELLLERERMGNLFGL